MAASPSGGEHLDAYCVHERKPTTMIEPEKFTSKNGRPMLRGKCISCGRTIVKILPKAQA